MYNSFCGPEAKPQLAIPARRLLLLFFLCISFNAARANVSRCVWETTKLFIVPDEPERAMQFIQENQLNSSFYPKFHVMDFESFDRVLNDGEANAGTYEAVLDGEEVFVKVISKRRGFIEALRTLFYNAHGLGVDILGVMENITVKEGSGVATYNAIVMKKLSGVNSKSFNRPDLLPDDFVLTQLMIDQMYQQVKVVYDSGMVPLDIQFLLTKKNATMIDFGGDYFYLSEDFSIDEIFEILDHKVRKWNELGRVEEGVAIPPPLSE